MRTSDEIMRKLIAKVLIASMAIFYTVVSVALCIGFGSLGVRLAESFEISQWWIVMPMIIISIALLAYLETLGWHEKYYWSPRKRLEAWAGLNDSSN